MRTACARGRGVLWLPVNRLRHTGRVKRVLAVVLASACGRVGFAPVPDGAPADAPADASVDDLLLHFEFDTLDPRIDSAQVAHPGACTSCPSIAAGRVGSGAAAFDSSQCLEIPGSRVLQPATFTFAAWLRPRVSHHGTVVGRAEDGTTSDTNTYEIWVEPTPTWNMAIQAVRAIGAVTPGDWHHYTGTSDGVEFVAYVDGVQFAASPAVLAAYTASDVTIGCDLNLGALVQRFDGVIDDVRLYSRALTPAEVAALAAM